MYIKRFDEHSGCRNVEQARPDFRRRIRRENVIASELAWSVQDYYVIEI
jgi:hypothetical protein